MIPNMLKIKSNRKRIKLKLSLRLIHYMNTLWLETEKEGTPNLLKGMDMLT